MQIAEFVEIDVIEAALKPIIAPVRKSPYILVMDIWERWMHLTDSQASHAESNPQDSKEFMAVGCAVDAMIDDLPVIQRWAISKARGLSPAVWRFKDVAIECALEDAEVALIPKMKKHLATKRYFIL